MMEWLNFLLFHPIWKRAPNDDSLWSLIYPWFNLFEATVWFFVAALILLRYLKNRHSSVELWYALAFFTFGLTDVREAFLQQGWLIAVKILNIALLIMLRKHVLTNYYPDLKAF